MTHRDNWQGRMIEGANAQDARDHAARCCDFPFEHPHTMREIHDHKTTGLNEAIKILALDDPGSGGANHVYALLLSSTRGDAGAYLTRTEAIIGADGVRRCTINHHSDGSIHIVSLEGAVIGKGGPGSAIIHFQNGPIKEAGFNGLTGEVLLAVQIDRMRGFQHKRFPAYSRHGDVTATEVAEMGTPGEFDFKTQGKFASRDNALSLTHTEDALLRLQKRTRDREARGVEGTHIV